MIHDLQWWSLCTGAVAAPAGPDHILDGYRCVFLAEPKVLHRLCRDACCHSYLCTKLSLLDKWCSAPCVMLHTSLLKSPKPFSLMLQDFATCLVASSRPFSRPSRQRPFVIHHCVVHKLAEEVWTAKWHGLIPSQLIQHVGQRFWLDLPEDRTPSLSILMVFLMSFFV